jgi:hypothetical protein
VLATIGNSVYCIVEHGEPLPRFKILGSLLPKAAITMDQGERGGEEVPHGDPQGIHEISTRDPWKQVREFES